MGIEYRAVGRGELERVSRQMGAGYKAAYAGLMDAAYLSALAEDHWTPALVRTLEAGGAVMVAEESGEIVGSAALGPAQNGGGPGAAELFALYLLPACIGRGIGHGLYTAAEAWMAAQGFTGCVLELLAGNARAMAFYIAHGYKEVRRFTVEENGMSLCCVAMRKALPAHE